MAASAASSGTDMNASAPGIRISHASNDASPQASPAMIVSSAPVTATRMPALALS